MSSLKLNPTKDHADPRWPKNSNQNSETIILVPNAPPEANTSVSRMLHNLLSSLESVGVALQAASKAYEAGMRFLKKSITEG